MKLVIQRVASASISVNGEPHARIAHGLVVLVGIIAGDTDEHAAWCADKIADMRIFEDANGKMNLSVKDLARGAGAAHAGVLLVPNFTLAGNAVQGNRPSFDDAMKPTQAGPMFERFVEVVRDRLREAGVRVESGVFRSHMQVTLTNDGPVTIVLDSRPPTGGRAATEFTADQWRSIGIAMGFFKSTP